MLPDDYLSNYSMYFPAHKAEYNTTAIEQLFYATDNLVIITKPSLSPGFAVADLEIATSQFETELQSFDVNLTQLLQSKVIQVFYQAMDFDLPSLSRCTCCFCFSLEAAPACKHSL